MLSPAHFNVFECFFLQASDSSKKEKFNKDHKILEVLDGVSGLQKQQVTCSLRLIEVLQQFLPLAIGTQSSVLRLLIFSLF